MSKLWQYAPCRGMPPLRLDLATALSLRARFRFRSAFAAAHFCFWYASQALVLSCLCHHVSIRCKCTESTESSPFMHWVPIPICQAFVPAFLASTQQHLPRLFKISVMLVNGFSHACTQDTL